MEVEGIKIKEGFLVKVSVLPSNAPKTEFNNFHRVALSQEGAVAICLPKNLSGWNTYPWCDPNKKYWWSYEDTVVEIKGYFSSEK